MVDGSRTLPLWCVPPADHVTISYILGDTIGVILVNFLFLIILNLTQLT